MAPVRALSAIVLVLALGCRSPGDDYDAFLARTCRGQPVGDAPVQSHLADIGGRWLVHALLAGGLDLGLRMQFEMNRAASPITLHARIWLATANADTDPPLVESDTTVNADGTFLLRAEPLVIPPGTLKTGGSVSANVVLHVSTLSADAWCGTATGRVEKPLSLDLAGSTFRAQRDDGKIAVADISPSCVPGMATPSCGMAGPVRPVAPDLSSVKSRSADISGQWILSAQLAGSLPVKLWASLTFVAAQDAGGGGSLDGALRRASDPPGTAALFTFTTTVDADGRFELWLPGLAIGKVRADLLLVAATLDVNGFCGKGAGQVQQPITLDLAGTTFGSARWQPGTAVPDTVPIACP